jgi:predicted nucleic acid-binding protein
MNKIILDTNIVSTFIKIEKLPLLASLFPNHVLTMSKGVKEELTASLFQDIPIDETSLSPDEFLFFDKFAKRYGSLGKGELECITICISRSIPMLTNDRKAKNVAIENGVLCWDLPEILRALLLKHLVDPDQLEILIKSIEDEDNIVFKNKVRLFDMDRRNIHLRILQSPIPRLSPPLRSILLHDRVIGFLV